MPDIVSRVNQGDRLSEILEAIAGGGSVSVGELASKLGASEATVRRDLRLLEDQRLLARTRGGAVSSGVLYELPLRYKESRRQGEKRRIAHAAAARVEADSAVGLSGGTTTTEVARALAQRHSLTIVTTALNIAYELAVRPNIKLVVTGGVARSQSYELIGPQASATLSSLNLDTVFLGVDGISFESGFTTHHELEADTNRCLIERGRRVIVVADSSKFGHVAFARISGIESVHEVITDDGVDAVWVDSLRDGGVEVTVV